MSFFYFGTSRDSCFLSGVNIKHVELEGRAEWGKTIPLNDQDIDANGHGSHVAVRLGSIHLLID